ncbi:MAG: hypothetical protein JW789_01790 [Candidatus Aenigmarchaeota archaeon]|nr:hypothetical protein [Candidatus Aenigmarchaeota archaeon]
MRYIGHDFRGDYSSTPAENARSFLDSVPLASDIFRDHDGNYLKTQPLAREAFRGPDGKLDAEKVYREGIASGKDAKYEFAEMVRYVLLLNPTKEETCEILDVFMKKHVPKSSSNPKARSRNSQQWYRQACGTFGLISDD